MMPPADARIDGLFSVPHQSPKRQTGSFLHFLATAEGNGHWSKTGKVCVPVVLAAE